MAREKIGDDVMKVRFPDGTFAAIDAVSSNRSEFIRYAVAEVLKAGSGQAEKSGGPVVSDRLVVPEKVDRSEKKFDGQAVKDGLRPDAVVLLTSISRGRMTSRQAAAKMGWLGLRYSNAEKQLIQAGLAKIEDGVLVAADCAGASEAPA